MEALENRDLAYKSMHITHLARMLLKKNNNKRNKNLTSKKLIEKICVSESLSKGWFSLATQS